MSIRRLVSWSALAFVIAGSASLAQAGVHIVDSSGQGDFTTIQAAVDASVDGDTVLVHAGDYAAFTVGDKSLAIYADDGADVEVQGTIHVAGLSSARTLVVSGIRATGASTLQNITVALSLTSNMGALRFQHCTFTGGGGIYVASAAHAVVVIDDANVSFVGCTLHGGDAHHDSNCLDCVGGRGGDGARVFSSSVALYECACIGGRGGASGSGGDGGTGYHAFDRASFASRSTFQGGPAGDGSDFLYGPGGDGGNGVWLEPAAVMHLVSPTVLGGAGGSALFPMWYGAPGTPYFGTGTVDVLPHLARVLVASTQAQSGGTIDITVFGQPGDSVFVPSALRTTKFKFSAALGGVWLIPFPAYLPVDPLGVIPSSGSLDLHVAMPELASGVDAAVVFLQGFIIAANGEHSLASPIHALVLR